MANTVLWIDDDPFKLRPYLDALERDPRNCTVKCFADVDSGYKAFIRLTKDNQLLGVILDMSMPVGNLFVDEARAQGGMRSGLLLYEAIREINPNVPVLFLSNICDPELIQHLQEQPLTWFALISEVLPRELLDLLRERFHFG